jgi:[ribosomal protein S5]-alanine N-acetyltransferase
MTQKLSRLFPVLKTPRLTLRALTFEDAKDVYAIFSDERVTRYYDVSTYTELEQAKLFIRRMKDRFEGGDGIRWAITLNTTNRLIGTCGYNMISALTRRGVMGYELHPNYWGQGIMTEALRANLNYGFRVLQLNRVEAFVLPDNHRSARVLKRLNFTEEGTMRDYGYWKNQYWDLCCFAMLERDWLG